MKVLLEKFCAESGVNIRLYTRVCSVNADSGRIKSVETESVFGQGNCGRGRFL